MQVAAAVLTCPAEVSLGDAVTALYTEAGDRPREALLMVASSSALRTCYIDTVTTIEGPLAEAITERHRGIEALKVWRPGT